MPSKTITATGSKGHHIFDLYVNETATSTSNNTSTVAFTFSMRPTGYDWYWSPPAQPVTWTVTINGASYSGAIYSYTANTTLTIKTGTQTVTHNSNGTKTIDISFSVSSLDYAYLPGSAAANGSLTLTSIARYPSITQSWGGATETTLTVKWSSDSIIDVLYYSTNDGSTWTAVDVADGKSGTYTITSLAPGAWYQVKTRVRSKASQLTATSATSSYQTVPYPYANDTPNFTVGQSVKIGLANPLGHSVTVQMRIVGSGFVAAQETTSGTSVTLTPTASVLYNAIPNSKTGNYVIFVWYAGSSIGANGGTYTANANVALPSATSLTYQDAFSRTTAITLDDQKIIQNKSRVTFTLSGLAGYEGSTVSTASISVNGTTHTMTIDGTTATVESVIIDSSADVDATATFTDSRGISSTKTVTITMIEYKDPAIRTTVGRQNNYYSETDIKADAVFSSINGKNTAQLAYQVKRSDGDYDTWVSINSGQTYTALLDNLYAWTIRFRIIDRLTTAYTYVDVLVGTPIMFIDRNKRSVSLNGFPNDEESLEVGGHDLRRHVITASLTSTSGTLIATSYTKVDLDTANVFGNKLSLEYGSVVIGPNVSKVLISGSLSIHASTTAGARSARVCQNGFSEANTVGWAYASAVAYDYVQLVIPPLLIDVQEGDELGLYYYAQSGDAFSGAFGGRTSLTVEFIA